MPFQSLDPALILATAEQLERRVAERFANRGLARVAAEVVTLARSVAREVEALTPPIWGLRALVAVAFWQGLQSVSGSARSCPCTRSGARRSGRSRGWRRRSTR